MSTPFDRESALTDFRNVVDADLKLNPNEYFLDRPDGWPHTGGPRYVYYYRVNENGTDRLHHTPNLPHTNDNHQRGNRTVNKWEEKGFKRVWGKELLEIIEMQQQRVRDRFASPDDPKPAPILPPADPDMTATPKRRGRPRANPS